ncbi:MAG TPA: hypothetical protein DCK95_06600 [Anaerolineaceae bacterium]|nr:hypothetical protein [Anaerolineaceae bacterium]
MDEVFGPLYADVYDALYHEKDYDEECDVIKSILETYGEGPIKSILDLGCGTASHSIRLAAQGYRVAGVDRSRMMLEIAQTKAEAQNVSVSFHHGDIKTINLGETFDAALVMFAVLGYQIKNEDVIQTLRNIRTQIKKGGLLIFDVWYGPAVLIQKPSEKIKIIDIEESKIIRLSSGILDTFRHVCRVRFKVYKIEKKQLLDETFEEHEVRFFFPQELAFFLQSSGFQLIHMGPFPSYNGELNETTWNTLVIAKGV